MSFRVAIISIGNEILLGRTVNTNLAWLAEKLALMGLSVTSNHVIKDEHIEIKACISDAWESNDIVICTGGLGPTQDDITKDAICEVFGTNLSFHQYIWDIVVGMFEARGMKTPEINRSQAMIPERFIALKNDMGTAPGLYYKDGQKLFFALPGVPLEMSHIFDTSVSTILAQSFQASAIVQKTIHTWDVSESALAELLSDFSCPSGVKLAWLPQTGRVDLRLYGQNAELIEQAFLSVRRKIEPYIWGFDEDTPHTALQGIMNLKGLTLSVAESCTAGLISKEITDCAGASKYFMGGVIAYSNDLKVRLLGVSQKTLDTYGAVSHEVVEEMAIGIKKLTDSNLAISVSGIAGPDGGTEEKPVGTVCFGIAGSTGVRSLTKYFTGTRSSIRHKASEFLVLQLIKDLRGL